MVLAGEVEESFCIPCCLVWYRLRQGIAVCVRMASDSWPFYLLPPGNYCYISMLGNMPSSKALKSWVLGLPLYHHVWYHDIFQGFEVLTGLPQSLSTHVWRVYLNFLLFLPSSHSPPSKKDHQIFLIPSPLLFVSLCMYPGSSKASVANSGSSLLTLHPDSRPSFIGSLTVSVWTHILKYMLRKVVVDYWVLGFNSQGSSLSC